VSLGFAVAAALTGMFSLLDIVGTLLCGAQHINGLSPTSQFSPSGGVMDAPNSPGAPDELSLINRLYLAAKLGTRASRERRKSDN
jgi:hypothetical protein